MGQTQQPMQPAEVPPPPPAQNAQTTPLPTPSALSMKIFEESWSAAKRWELARDVRNYSLHLSRDAMAHLLKLVAGNIFNRPPESFGGSLTRFVLEDRHSHLTRWYSKVDAQVIVLRFAKEHRVPFADDQLRIVLEAAVEKQKQFLTPPPFNTPSVNLFLRGKGFANELERAEQLLRLVHEARADAHSASYLSLLPRELIAMVCKCLDSFRWPVLPGLPECSPTSISCDPKLKSNIAAFITTKSEPCFIRAVMLPRGDEIWESYPIDLIGAHTQLHVTDDGHFFLTNRNLGIRVYKPPHKLPINHLACRTPLAAALENEFLFLRYPDDNTSVRLCAYRNNTEATLVSIPVSNTRQPELDYYGMEIHKSAATGIIAVIITAQYVCVYQLRSNVLQTLGEIPQKTLARESRCFTVLFGSSLIIAYAKTLYVYNYTDGRFAMRSSTLCESGQMELQESDGEVYLHESEKDVTHRLYRLSPELKPNEVLKFELETSELCGWFVKCGYLVISDKVGNIIRYHLETKKFAMIHMQLGLPISKFQVHSNYLIISCPNRPRYVPVVARECFFSAWVTNAK